MNKILDAFWRFVSFVMTPLLMPAYGVMLALWTSVLCYIEVGTRLMVVLMVTAITCLLPMIFIAVLHNAKVITDKRLVNRNERWLPYIFMIVCYIAAAFYLRYVHSPNWLVAIVWGALGSAVVAAVVTLWWKISAHATGAGGLFAVALCIHDFGLSVFNMMGVVMLVILLCGLVCTSRLMLNRHTTTQVLAGFCNGFLCVDWAMKLLG